jgi:hypothetical protein
MNTHLWTEYFRSNLRNFHEPPLPPDDCRMPAWMRLPLMRSLAIFQLGESGGGTRLMRYVRTVVGEEQWRGYENAVALFIEEEQYHAELLGRVLEYLGGARLEKQWSNSTFRWLRNQLGMEFNIQILLVAELIAEIYYALLHRRCADAAIRACCLKILRDEMRHIAFHAEFFRERLGALPPWKRTLWRTQFRVFHAAAALVVAWDHRSCFKALGVGPFDFLRQATGPMRRFLRRLEKSYTLWAVPSGPLSPEPLSN